jgi:hypothetical protein
MVTTEQRTNVHGILEASREWQRIVELAFRRGLGEVPTARPEFALIDRGDQTPRPSGDRD